LSLFLVLDVFVVTEGCADGLLAASLSLAWDPAHLLGIGGEECPSPPNAAPLLCNDISNRFFQPINVGVTVSPGLASSFDAFSSNFPTAGYFCQTMHLGRMDFFLTNQGNTTVVLDYQAGVDVINDQLGNPHLPPATAFIEPPGCF